MAQGLLYPGGTDDLHQKRIDVELDQVRVANRRLSSRDLTETRAGGCFFWIQNPSIIHQNPRISYRSVQAIFGTFWKIYIYYGSIYIYYMDIYIYIYICEYLRLKNCEQLPISSGICGRVMTSLGWRNERMEEPIDCGQNWFQWLGGTTFQIRMGVAKKMGVNKKRNCGDVECQTGLAWPKLDWTSKFEDVLVPHFTAIYALWHVQLPREASREIFLFVCSAVL